MTDSLVVGVRHSTSPVHLSEPITSYTSLVAAISSGSKKHGLTQWWLNLIETKVGGFPCCVFF